jgi:hypothetical protein
VVAPEEEKKSEASEENEGNDQWAQGFEKEKHENSEEKKDWGFGNLVE